MPARLPSNLVKRGQIYYVRKMIDGRRIWRSTGHTQLKSAMRKADEMKVQLRQDRDFGKGEAPFYTDWVRDYLQTYSVKKRGGILQDTNTVKASLTFFARYRIDELTPTLCNKYLNERDEVRAPATVNLERAVLGAVLQKAVEDGLLEKNPWRKTAARKTSPRIRLLTPENELLLRAVMKPEEQRWLTFLLGSGLRIQEARMITENEVDFARELLHVPEEGAKGGKARSVPLRPEVAAVIREQLRLQGRLWHKLSQSYQWMLEVRAVKAGIPHLSPHDLRHTFATRYLRGGGNIYTLSKILGHASVATTEKIYVHLVPTDLVEMSRGVDLGLAS